MKYKIYFLDYISTIGLKDDQPLFNQDYTGKYFTLIDEDEAMILRLKHPSIKLYQLSKDEYEV